jgi:hypothetical protein
VEADQVWPEWVAYVDFLKDFLKKFPQPLQLFL